MTSKFKLLLDHLYYRFFLRMPGSTLARKKELLAEIQAESMSYRFLGELETEESLPPQGQIGDCYRILKLGKAFPRSAPDLPQVVVWYKDCWEVDRIRGVYIAGTVEEKDLPASTRPGHAYFVIKPDGFHLRAFIGTEDDPWLDSISPTQLQKLATLRLIAWL